MCLILIKMTGALNLSQGIKNARYVWETGLSDSLFDITKNSFALAPLKSVQNEFDYVSWKFELPCGGVFFHVFLKLKVEREYTVNVQFIYTLSGENPL